MTQDFSNLDQVFWSLGKLCAKTCQIFAKTSSTLVKSRPKLVSQLAMIEILIQDVASIKSDITRALIQYWSKTWHINESVLIKFSWSSHTNLIQLRAKPRCLCKLKWYYPSDSCSELSIRCVFLFLLSSLSAKFQTVFPEALQFRLRVC